jgi:hypothetical protein
VLIYLAAGFSRRAEIAGYAQRLGALGHVVVSRWLDEPDEHADPPAWMARQRAVMDEEDLRRAEWVVVFTGGKSHGGYHAEFGMARALGKPILLVGERECVFHHLDEILHFQDPEELFAGLEFEAKFAGIHGAANDRRPTPRT